MPMASTARVNSSLPYATATFQNNGVDNVKLTLDLTNLTSGEFVGEWLFNYTGNANTLGVVPAFPGELSSVVTSDPQALTGGSNMKAGLFNVEFNFFTAANQNRFSGGESIILNLTGVGLSEDDFCRESADELNRDGSIKNPGGWVSAMDVQGIPSTNGTTSGSFGGVSCSSVPEPTGMAFLGGLAVLALPFLKRRRG